MHASLCWLLAQGQRGGVLPLLNPHFSSNEKGRQRAPPVFVVCWFLIPFSLKECKSDIFWCGIFWSPSQESIGTDKIFSEQGEANAVDLVSTRRQWSRRKGQGFGGFEPNVVPMRGQSCIKTTLKWLKCGLQRPQPAESLLWLLAPQPYSSTQQQQEDNWVLTFQGKFQAELSR